MGDLSNRKDHSLRVTKYAVMVAAGWTLVSAVFCFWAVWGHKDNATTVATLAARAAIEDCLTSHKWRAPHHQSSSSEMRPASTDALRAHMICSVASRIEYQPDTWEKLALAEFAQGAQEVIETQRLDGRLYLRVMQPLTVRPACLECHTSPHFQLGSSCGGVSSSIPLDQYAAVTGSANTSALVRYSVLWLFGLLGLCLAASNLRRRELARREAEGALHESWERFDLAIRGTGVGLWDWQVQTGGLVINQRWAAMLGYTLEDLQPISIETWRRLCHPDDLVSCDAQLERHFAGDLPLYESEIRLRHRNGHWVWVLDRGSVVERDDQNRPIRMTGTHLEITDRKRAQEALHDSDLRLRSTLEAANTVAWEVNAVDGSHHEVGPVDRLFGRPSGFRHPGVSDLFASMHSEDRDRVIEAMSRALRGEAGYNVEYRTQSEDGKIRWLTAKGTLQRDDQGRPDRLLGIAQDITQHKVDEQALLDSEARYRTVVEQAGDAVFLHDETGRILDVNHMACQNLGYTRAELLATSIADIDPQAIRAGSDVLWKRVVAGGHEKLESYQVRKDGSTFPVEITLGGVMLPSGPTVLGIVRDITERKRIEAERAREQNLVNAVMNGTDVMLCYLDTEFNFVMVNPAYADTCHMSAAEIIGRNHFDLYPDSENEAIFRQVRDTGESVFYKDKPFEFADQPERGTTYWDWSLVPVNDDSGAVQGLIFSLRETTKYKKMELALEETERQQAALISSLPGFVYRCANDTSWTMKYISDGCFAVTGYSAFDLLNNNRLSYSDLVHPDFRKILRQRWQELLANGRTFEEEYPIITARGEKRWVWERGRGVYSPEGTLLFLEGFITDVTERRLAQDLAAARGRVLQVALAGDTAGVLRLVLDEAEELTGSKIGFFHFLNEDQETLTLQEWSTRTVTEFCKAEGRGTHYSVASAGVWVDCVHQRRPIIYNNYEALPHRKGMPPGHANVSRFLSVPIHRGESIVAIIGVGNKPEDYVEADITVVSRLADLCWDIVELKLAEESLRRSEVRHAAVIESAQDGYCLVDMNGRIVGANKAMSQMSGFSIEQLLTMGIADLEVCHTPEIVAATIQEVMQKQCSRFESRHRRADGSQYDVAVSIQYLPMDGGRLVSFITDITDRKAAQQSLAASERNLRSLFETIGDIIFVASPEGRILAANQAFGRKLGRIRDEYSRMQISDLFAPDVWPEAAEAIAEMTRGARDSYRQSIVHSNGPAIPVEMRVWSGQWDGRSCLFGICEDLTAELEASQRFERLFRNNPVPMAVSDLESARFVDVNNATVETTGYSREELIGRTPEELMLFVLPQQHRAASHSLRHDGSLEQTELQLRRRDGSLIDGILTGEIITYGGRPHFLTVMIDMTKRKEAERAASEIQRRLDFALEKTQTGTFNLNLVDRTAHRSKEHARIFGYDSPDGAWSVELFLDHVVVEDREWVRQCLQEALANSQDWHFECRIRRVDGAIRWISVTGGPQPEETGPPVRAAGVIQDITDRVQAEDALAASRSILEAAMANMTDAVFISDLEGRFIDFNEAFATFHKFRSKEECARTLAEYPAFIDVYLPDGSLLPFDQWAVPRALRGEAVANAQYTLRRSDTGETWVGSYSFAPIRDKSGAIVGAVVVGRDVTEQKKAHDALRDSEKRYQQLFASVMEGICLIDCNEIIEFCNPAFVNMIEAQSPSDVVGRNLRDFIPKELHEKLDAESTNRRLGVSGQYEIDVVTFKGSRRTLLASISPRLDSAGVYYGAIGGVIDITETKRLQAQETRAQRLETAGQVAGQVAHDFNNMLAPMMAYPELIREQLPDGDPNITFLEAIESSAHKMADLNQQLLTLSRRGHYNLEVLNLNTVVRDVLGSIGPLPESLVLDVHLAGDLMNIKGGIAQLHRVVMNLIVNARDAMQDVGRLTVQTDNQYLDTTTLCYGRVPRGEYVRLTIGDTGCGIPEDVVQRIFDPFFTTKAADKKRGSGLGLSVVDAVVKDHDGFLDMTTLVGAGTSFYLYFPICRAIGAGAQSEEVPRGTESLLIVDDDDIQRDVMARLLSTLGYQVTTCHSGGAALDLLKTASFDLLVLDMIMPNGIDGAETYHQAIQINPGQRAIIVSGFSESDRVAEAQRMGAGLFVRKPISRKIMAQAVRCELDRAAKTSPETTPVLSHRH